MADGEHQLHRPPLNLLVDPTALRHVKPWQVNIKYLLDLFKSILPTLEARYPRLHLHASAVLSSSTLYKLKVENLYTAERAGGRRVRASSLGDVPALLTMAFRQEVRVGDVEELLEALERILKAEARAPPSSEMLSRPAEYWEPDAFTLQIQSHLDDLRARLASLLAQRPEIMFSELVVNCPPLEVARIFILLLFLAQEGHLVLENQDDDIRVTGIGPVKG